ncbi:MAG: DoxX family protein [Ekhidna sp.]
MEKRNKIIFWIATGALGLMMLMSAGMYFINTDQVVAIFISLGYNERIVIPLAIMKILGVVALISNKSQTLKEWAYFGFLLDFSLALEAHLAAKDGGHITAVIALVLWAISYVYDKKIGRS